ncbi:tetratricopeptide repeat protein [Thermobrachium celere]|uniref:tetratricopeptide repeat protein n=1 Tax=Thermobrachium celere TaxID=53422 RepID=UPI001942BEB4|nr:tetratricopeptide repeat protein [Thermobrachium celere]GFR34973.1 hypothetical protein TCEA9_07850 [Thermobrachium celere]
MLKKVQLLDAAVVRDDLYNIVKTEGYIADEVIEDLTSIIDVFEEIKMVQRISSERLIADLIAKYFNKSSSYINLLIKFLKEQGLIDLEHEVKITSKGKLLKYLDRHYLSTEILRFVLLNLNWEECFRSRDILLNLDSRRYVFAMVSQTNSKLVEDMSKLKENKVYNSSYFGAITNINSSSGFKKVVEECFVKLNLGYVKKDFFIPNNFGMKVFKYLSRDLLDQYNRLLDECWDYYDRGNFEQAFDIASSIIKVLLFVPEAYNVLGCVYIKMGDIEKARDMFNFAIEVYEKTSFGDIDADSYISLYYNLGLSYYYINDNFKALKIFKTIKKSIPYKIDNLDELIEGIKAFTLIRPSN